jgi:hypothetical protein
LVLDGGFLQLVARCFDSLVKVVELSGLIPSEDGAD